MIKPPPLKSGDKVALVAPAKTLEKSYLQQAVETVGNFDVEVIRGNALDQQHFQFAGTDEQRLTDLQRVLDDEHIKAIFCLRGGHGTYRLLHKLNFTRFSRYPKWIIGFSDITYLHVRIQQIGFCSLHGAMPMNYARHNEETEPVNTIKQILQHEAITYDITPNPLNKTGQTQGIIVGGNLSVLYGLQATPYELDTTHKILFLEDVGESLYHIDRMMMNMLYSGKLDRLKGLVIGEFNQLKDEKKDYGMSAYEIIQEKVKPFNYPVLFGFPAGHMPRNLAFCLGSQIRMDVNDQSVKFIQ